jgi:DNA-binding winged helix-turn-helix (wHTH) protein
MVSPEPEPTRIRFDVFELDATSGELRESGILRKLQPQPFRVLLLLIEHAGQVVTREEIQRCLWRDSTFVDFEHGINFSINQIRGALADNADDPRYVETLPRRGYRFIGTVEQNLVPKQSNTSVWDRDENGPTRKLGRNSGSEAVPMLHWRSGVALVIFAAAFAGAAYLLFHRVSPMIGIKQRRLTANPSGMPVDRAVISPDGKYLAYSDQSGIHLQLIGANESHTLEAPPGFSPRQAGLYPVAWFPGGTRLLLNTALAGQRSIWVSSILGGFPLKLRDDAAGQSVSPDGSLIAFTANITLIGDHEVWLMAPDGEDAHKLVTVDEHSGVGRVVWSPDGQWIAYQRFHWEADKFQVSVESCDLKGTQPGVLLSDPALIDFWWGQEGRLIYSRSEPQPNEKIRISGRSESTLGLPSVLANLGASRIGQTSPSRI